MTSGAKAEKFASEYLKKRGFTIIDTNWKTRTCEIDIVARKSKRLYFVEVKYRKNSDQGSGLAYITPAKLKQMTFAAYQWVSVNDWAGDYSLSAIEVSGDGFSIDQFLIDL